MSDTILIPANGQPITTVAELNDVLAQAASKTSGAYEIDLGANADIALTSEINAINLQAGVTLDIEGNGATLNGENTTRGLFVYSGVVTIENLTIANAKAVGGDGNALNGAGGGGGAGLGGGLFLANDTANHAAPANVTLANVLFRNDAAAGGNGAAGSDTVGGGGGLGGLAGGTGGGAGPNSGGGIGGTAGQGGHGGHGGFGGGGGGELTGGGGGGFGGGGGSFGGAGGFGGGGGGGGELTGGGGFGGGKGGNAGIFASSGGGGGGGLGAGGDIFVMDGATLTIASGSLSGGTVTKGTGGGPSPLGSGVGAAAGADGEAYGSGIFLQGDENLNFTPVLGDKVTISDVIADEFGSGGGGVGATAKGTLTLDGAGTLELDAVNTFAGGITIKSGTLDIGLDGTAGSGTISFAGHSATLELDTTPADGSTAPNALSNFAGGDRLDLAGLVFAAGATATVVGSTLVVTSGGTTENFSLLNLDTAGPHYVVTSDGGATPGTLVTAVDSLAISGTTSGQITSFGTPVTPFAGVTLTDASNGATDTLTITLSSADVTLTDGAGFHGLSFNSGAYTLSGTADTISAELDALVFTPGASAPGTYPTTTFTLAATSTSGATTGDSTTSVIDADPADLTISGTTSGQVTTFESPVDPFAEVTITDPNVGTVDQLTITLSGGGGTLADGAGFQGLGAPGAETYTLSGTAEAITTELDALVFTPAADASNPTTTFTLTDTSSAIRSLAVSDSSTSVDNFDEAVPTFSGTHSSVAHNAPVDLFAGASISDTNVAGTTDTLTITLSGTGGTLTGAGLSGGVNGVYTLVAATPDVLTTELQGVVFTPTAGAPQTIATTTFTLSAVSSAGSSASDHTTAVENLNTTNTVLVAGDGNAAITTVAELNDVLVQAAGKTSGAYEIDLGPNADIALTTALEAVNLHSGVTLDIEGDGATLDGQNSTHGLFIYSGTVTIENLTVANAKAVGGNAANGYGGGGGAGLGGGLFLANDTANHAAPANVTLANVLFRNDGATGGNGAQGFNIVGGGGGLGGVAGGTGSGDGPNSGGGIGGTAGHGGLGGGIGSQPGPNGPGIGGQGGFGGGGGGSATGGGGGGFGGGGGSFGGAGGFGGGGGGGGIDTSNNPTTGGNGGFGGGKGGHAGIYYGSGGGGGGGLGAGGDIFVMDGATLTIASGSLSGGTVTAGDGGNPAPVAGEAPGGDAYVVYGDPGADGAAYGSGIFLQGDENLNFAPALGDKVTISDVIADEFGSGGSATAKGTLTLNGAGTLELDAVNTFGGGITIKSGTLEIGLDGTAGSGAISFAGHSATLELDTTPADGSTAPNALSNFAGGDRLDLAGLVFAAGATATVVGSTLVVSSGGTTENFSLLDPDTAGVSYVVTSDGVIPPGDAAPGTLVTSVDSLAISGTASGQIVHQTSVTPFAGVTLTDSNNGATDTLTITLSNADGTLTDGAGFHGLLVHSGVYELSGTAAAISAELDALVFTPGAPGTPPTTTFTLAATSTAGFSTSDSTTSVINVDVTISETFAGQSTAFEAPVAPFAGVTVADPNVGATDTLTITLSGGGALADGAGFHGLTPAGTDTYTLSGPADAISAEFDALVFTPSAGAPNAPSTTTFTLSDASSAISNVLVSDSGTSVTDFDQAIPTFSGTHSSVVENAPVDPFAGASISDANGAGTTDTLTITLSGAGGTLTGAGLSGGVNGVYTLAAATPGVLTTELQGLVFTPTAGAPHSTETTVFTLSATSSAGTFASDHATEVQSANTSNSVLAATDGQTVITTVAELNEVLAQAAGKTGGAYEIDLGANAAIVLSTALDAINLHSGVTLDIEGNGATLDGQNSMRGLFVYSGTVTIENLTIANAVAAGGAGGSHGGGGGAGLGGGLFVANDTTNNAAPANVTLNNVNFSNDAAIGGNGGSASNNTAPAPGEQGGGGGLGSDGGSGNGLGFNGGFSTGFGGGGGIGITVPGLSGGAGASVQTVTGGGGGGIGGGAGSRYFDSFHSPNGGNGGFGGGGGAGEENGDGGFGGGGGAGTVGSNLGGHGGFGGGGGAANPFASASGGAGGGGFGAGNGGNGGAAGFAGGGGGGLGAGGDIFVMGGATLTIVGGSLGAGTVTKGFGGSGAGDGQAFGSGIFLEGSENLHFAPAQGTTVTISGVIADQAGSVAGASGLGILTLDGTGTLELDAVNTFTGGVTIDSGTLAIGTNGTAGSGTISFAGHPATLQLDATPADGSTAANVLSNFVGGDRLDLAGLGFVAGATATVVGSTLVVTSGGTTENFSLLDLDTAGAHYVVTSDGGATPGTLVTAVDSLAISGTTSGQITSFGTPVTPFAGVTLTDASNGAMDTLTITLSSADGTLTDGAGFHGLSFNSGAYTLSGTAGTISSELDALLFTPNPATPGTYPTTTFTLAATSTSGATTSDSTASVTNADPATLTISGTVSGQSTTFAVPVDPFAGVTITDPNVGTVDQLTITLSGGGGTLADGAGFQGLGAPGAETYTLSGTAEAITTELDALVFTPAVDASNPTTTFTLTDTSSAIRSLAVSDSSTSVDNFDEAVPTFSGTHSSVAHNAPVDLFAGASISDTNVAGTTDTLTITLSGTGGTLTGAGLSGGVNGVYTLVAATPDVLTTELQGVVFTPTAGAPQTIATTTFTLSAVSSAGSSASDHTTAVENLNTTNTVLVAGDGNAAITTVAELNDVLVQAAGKTSGAYEIDLGPNADIALTTALEAVNLHSGVTLDIEGDGATLDGQNSTRGLFIYSGTVTIENLTIANALAAGGAGGSHGGGGGAGLGGGLFVANDTTNNAAPANVTLNNVNFSHDAAVGGNGGIGGFTQISAGGGGGLGGNGGNGGLFFVSGGLGGSIFGGGGGIGPGIVPGLNSGAGSGGGTSIYAGGGGGGIGGGAGSSHYSFFTAPNAGNGGFGGGGGAGDVNGDGGFGGGGGGGTVGSNIGGHGGFGGGGGAASADSSRSGGAGGGGFGAGNGGNLDGPAGAGNGGGGGLGAGGDIFVMGGATLTIVGGSLGAGTVTKGLGGIIPPETSPQFPGGAPGSDGDAFGGGIFLQGNENIHFAAVQGTTVAISGVIADEAGSVAGTPDFGTLTLDGAGTVELAAVNTFAGGVTINSGTLEIAAGASAGSGEITFGAPATLQLDEQLAAGTTTAFANSLADIDIGGHIDLQGLTYIAGATANVVGSTLTVTSGTTSETFTLADSHQVFEVTGDGQPGTAGTLVTAVDIPTITGTVAGQSLFANSAITPFSGTAIGDLNSGATDTLTITLSDPSAGMLADGTGFAGTPTLVQTSLGIYSLSGTATALTAELQALTFQAGNGTPGTPETTTLTLTDTSSAGPSISDSTTELAVIADGNPVSGPGIGSSIDVAGLAYSTDTSFSSGGLLTVGDHNFNLSGVAGDVLLLNSDGAGGTIVTAYATLSDAINAVNAEASGNYTIQLTGGSVETVDPAAINLASGVGLTVSGADGNGGSYVLDGGAVAGVGGHRGLFVEAGSVTIEHLLIQNAQAIGGNGSDGLPDQLQFEGGGGGGGGGAGLGGALFVASGGAVSLIDVAFAHDSATGGAGGSGGGAGHNTGDTGTGGSGGAGSGGFGTGGHGGNGGAPGRGPQNAGGSTFGGGGGGGAGGVPGFGGPLGGAGGGFGAGAGGGGTQVGNGPSTSGGGGGSANAGGSGGGGGGGLAAGGDIFVQAGGTLIIDGGSLVDGTVTGGTGANPGLNFGKGLFLQGDATATFTAASGDIITVAFTITDQNGSVQADIAGESGNVAIGDVAGTLAGTVDLTGTDTYTGTTTVNAGTLLVDGAIAGSAVEVKSGTTLGGHGITGAVTVDAGGTFSPGDSPGQITVASLTLASGSHFEEQIGGMTAGSGYDQTVVESGGIISLNGATLDVTDYNGFVPTLGILTIIDNQDPTAAVTGVFDDAQGNALTQGSVITVAGVDFRINYHGGDGNDVTLSDLNVAPTLTATAANPTFTGNVLIAAQGAAVTVFTGADAEVVDRGTSIIGLNLTVEGLQDGASENLIVDGTTITLGGASSGTTSGDGLNYSVSFANGTATIVFTTGGTSAATIDSIIDGIAYQDTNTSDPTAGDRTITLTQIQNSGGTGDGGVDTATVSIASTVHVAVIDNQPPTLTAVATDPTFTGNVLTDIQAAAVTAFSGASANTVESGQSIIGLNLTVGGVLDGASETITVDGSTISLGGASSGSTSGHDLSYSVSLLNGTATIAFTSNGTAAAAIDTIIDGIAYQDTNAGDPTAGDRTITLTQIQDNGGTLDGGVDTTALSIASTVHVDVTNNQPPTLTATADNPNFIESAHLDTQAAPVTMFSGTNASAIEPGQSIIGLDLTVGGLQDGTDETVIVDGSTISLGGASSGSTSGHDLAYTVSSSGGTATISFSSSGTSADVIDGIIDGIAYQNTNENNPTAGGRAITVQIQDNGGTVDGGVDTSVSPISSTVTVVPVNYAPSLTATPTNSTLDTIAPLQPIAIPFASADAGTVKSGETFSGFTFTVGGLLDGANETVTVDGTTISFGADSNGTTAYNGLTYEVSLVGGTATVTLSGSAVSAATIDGIIDGMTYADTLANATSGERTITLTQIQESGGTANGGVDTAAVSIAAAVDLADSNNPPTVSANPDGLLGGLEIQVNTATAGNQDDPQIAALKNGGYVVTWQDGDPTSFSDPTGSLGVGGATGDSSGTAVKAQVFAADGAPEGSEILVNTTTAGNQFAPAIAALDDGDFAVTWTNAGNVDGQLFSATGAKEGVEFQVNTSGSGAMSSITALAGGGFTVVWASGLQLEAQTFAADGTEVGSQVQFGSFYPVTGQATPAAITALSGGGFAATWLDLNSNVEAQAFSAAGTPIGAATVIGANALQLQPAIAALNNGGFAVTWSDGNAIDVQTLSAQGAALGPLIHVDQSQIGNAPVIATLSDGDFVIAWTSVANQQSFTETNLMAQIFTPDGEAAASPITVWSVVDSGFGSLEVTALANGQFAVTSSGDNVISSVFSATGAFIGNEFVGTPDGPNFPVAALANNGVAIAWPEFTNSNGAGDGDGNGIKAEVFDVAYQETAGTALNLKNAGLSVGDVDGQNGTETLTLSVTEGILNVAAGGSQATVAGSGSGLVTIDGTVAEINALLNTDATSSISFTDANPNPAHNVTLTLTMDDNGNSGSGGPLTATAVATIEVAVQLANTVPGMLLVPEGVATEIAGLSVTDRDAVTLTTTLEVFSGTLTVGAVDGASVSGSGTQEVTISGTLAQVDAALSAANNVLYQGNFFGVDALEMTSNANGNFLSSGPETATSFVGLAVGVPALLAVVPSGTGITNGNGDLNADNHIVTLTFEMSDVVYVSGGIPVLSLNDGGSATYSGGSGTDALTFTYQVMPGDNTAALAINGYNFGGASFLDAAGNGADLNSIFGKLAGTVQIDTTAPTVSIAADHAALLAGQTSTVTFTFSEAVSFGLGDATVTGGSLGNLVHVGLNGSDQDIYTATFTPDAVNSETGSVQLGASSYSDLAGNNGAASNTLDFGGDTLAPTVSIAANHTALLAGQTAAVTFTFSEAVSFALSDATVTDGSLGNLVHVGLNGSDQDVYTATFTPDAANHEAGSLQVIASSYADLAGNNGAASNALNFSGDTLAPTVSIAADHAALLAGQTSTVTFTFSEAVSFGLGDATVTGGSLGNLVHVGLNGSDQDIYTATFTPDAVNSETGSVQLGASSYSDLAGNNGAASNTLDFGGDTLAPTVSIAANHTALLAGQTAAVTFTFSEAVSFALSDATVTDGSLGNLVHVGLNGSDQDVYTATFTPDAANHEAGSLQVIASSYADLAGNDGAASNTVNFTGDTLAPTVSVAAGDTALLAGQTSTATFTFSEAVSNFVLGDTTVTGGTLGDLVHVGLNGSNQDIYTATFTPGVTNTEAGSIQVNAASYADLAGNDGAASNTLNFTGDTLAPTVSIAADRTALLAGQTAALTFTFSEAVSFALSDATVTGGSLGNLVHVGLNGADQDIYTATFTPVAVNTEAGSVEINATGYTDLAGNTGASSNTLDFSGDTLAPTATAVATPLGGTEYFGDLVQIALTFAEAVTIAGTTPALALNDGGTASYDAAATAALNNPDKLVFDYTVGAADSIVSSLAITGIAHGAITDLAGNAANVDATFAGLQVISSVVTANSDSNHVTASQALSVDAAFGVLANDTDTNATDHLFVSAVDGLAVDVNQPIADAYGTLTLHADGSYTYIANNMSVGVGVDNFVYTTSDGHGQTSTSTLAVTVTGANDSYTQMAPGGSATSGGGNVVLDGSAGNATLTAAPTLNAHPVLIGGPNDTLNAASFGQDTFVFNNNFGHEIVNNFQPAIDVIQLQQSEFGSLANVLADIQQEGANSVLTLDANHIITLTNIQHTSLTAADFHLM